jgi:hypothetical protein
MAQKQCVPSHVREYIQKFPDWVDNEININNKTVVEKQRKDLVAVQEVR